MWEFLQANSSWIILGVSFLLMMAMHGGHGGHSGTHDGSDEQKRAGTTPERERDPRAGAAAAPRVGHSGH